MEKVPSRTLSRKRFLLPLSLLFALLQSTTAANVQGITTTVTSGSPDAVLGFRQGSGQGQTYYSGATSSSYAATTIEPPANSGFGLGFSAPTSPASSGFPGATLSSVGTSNASAGVGTGTGGAQLQQQQQFLPPPQQLPQFQEEGYGYQSADYGVPPALDLGLNLAPAPLSAVLRPGEYVPNCGCVTLGACQREIGQYTRVVGEFSDVVCGLNFERCCFDGPCPGVLDEFVRAAPCVPQEQCLRPYGVLPTDVRDFGTIAPCPGQGAVRCISVNDAQLLDFQAAVAAIEASQARFTAATAVAETEAEENAIVAPPAPQPQQIVVPIVRKPVPAPVPAISGHAMTTSVTNGDIDRDNELVSNIATFLASNGIGTGTGTTVQAVSKGETADVVLAPPPRVVNPAITAPAAQGYGSYSGCRSAGCYTPWAYRGGYAGAAGCGFPGCSAVPGFGGVGYGFPGYGGVGYGFPGYGAGVGGGVNFHKGFQISKGIGWLGR